MLLRESSYISRIQLSVRLRWIVGIVPLAMETFRTPVEQAQALAGSYPHVVPPVDKNRFQPFGRKTFRIAGIVAEIIKTVGGRIKPVQSAKIRTNPDKSGTVFRKSPNMITVQTVFVQGIVAVVIEHRLAGERIC